MAEPNMLIPLPDEMARLMKLTQWQAEQIERLRARVFALEDAQGGDVIPLAEPRTPDAQRTAEICLSEWATARMEAMEAAIGALQREAHTWWTACRDATGEVERLREVAARMVTGIDHLDKLTREWEPDHSSGADRRGWLLAKDARDDAARLLGPNVGANRTAEGGPVERPVLPRLTE